MGASIVLSSSAKKIGNDQKEYQPGGVVTAITGKTTGRHIKGHSDPWGRFTWTKLRGKRAEGIILISAYRVCQKKGAVTGPTTAYMQQIGEMMTEELRELQALERQDRTIPQSTRRNLDPRSRLLEDLKTLISTERGNGFRPIICMDANEDWLKPDGKELKEFITSLQLVDFFHQKYPNDLPRSTYARGQNRIDYILFDRALIPAVSRIGSLGLHEGMVSDHVLLYADLDEKKLFQGIVNRPVRVPCREFVLAQADKCENFIKQFLEYCEECNFKSRVISLNTRLEIEGPTEELVRMYNILDNEIQERILATAKKVVKKKFGYARSPALGDAGFKVNFWKSVHSAKCLRQPIPNATVRKAEKLEIPMQPLIQMSTRQARTQVREAVQELREVQYDASTKRQEWLEVNAQIIARAAGEPDWKKHMELMLRQEKDREINRKLTAIVKGPHQSLNWIEVPIGEWFFSREKGEIYRYDKGVFESYSAWSPQPGLIPTSPWKFYSHHHLKVPHDDIVHAQVSEQDGFLILEAVYKPATIWRTVTDVKEIETLLLERNKRHLQQASIEAGRVHDPLMQSLMSDHGTDLMQEVYDGTISIPDATDEVIAAWIESVKQTDAERLLPPIQGVISKTDFQEAFRKVSEKTSSSPSGLHYTIWKCLARHDDIASWMCIMMSLPFQHGFINNRWTKCLDVMLEKKTGNRKIHMLRIIALLEADFNTALKYFFAKRMMQNAEAAGLNDEQWGSRPRRMALDPAMHNMMTFEYGRYMRATIAMFAADLTACFDRMFPSLSNLTAGKFGVDVNILRCRGKVIEALRRAVRTGNGESDATYGNEPGYVFQIAGECQGKGDVALLYAILSSINLDAHGKLYEPMILPGPTPGPCIAKRNDGYVDDVNTWAGILERELGVTDTVLYNLNKGAQSLTNLNETSGGSTAFHKCATQLLTWISDRKKLVINYHHDHEGITLLDAKGAASKIKMMRPEEANKSLGYHMAVDANQHEHYASIKGKIAHICNGAQSGMLSFREARELLTLRLLQQAKYGLYLSQFSLKMCNPLTVMINGTFLQLMHVHSKTPRAIVWGPIDLGGLGLNTDIYCLQAQCAIGYLVRSLRWNKTVASDIITVLNACQLASGLEFPLLEHPDLPIRYISAGWIPHLREMLLFFGIKIWVEDAWKCEKQRVNDRSIMEMFVLDKDIKLSELILANEYRMWLGVIFISDLADVTGTEIDFGRIANGSEWRAIPTPGFKWPNTIVPTNEHRRVFRKCLRMSFCPDAGPWSRSNYKLRIPLGKWYPVRRHIQHECYRSNDCIYYRDEFGLHKCVEKGNTGFYTIPVDTISDEPPIYSHPIICNKSGPDTIWTRRPVNLEPITTEEISPKIIQDDLPVDYTDHVDLVSDAAVHTDTCKGAICWHAVSSSDERLSASRPVRITETSYSYREELVGIYDGIKYTNDHRPLITDYTCHCDNEAGINKLSHPLSSPGAHMEKDADVIMAIHHLIQDKRLNVEFKHVKGHANEKKKLSECTAIELINIDCDEGAEECVQSGMTAPQFHPFPGSKCMIQVDGEWVTEKVEPAIQYSIGTTNLEQYLVKRLSCDLATVRDIDRRVIKIARSPHRWARTVRTTKMMNRWMPVGHNWRHHNADTDRCPCCGQSDETFDHLFRCSNVELRNLRRVQLSHISKVASELKIPPAISTLILFLLRGLQNPEMPEPTLPPILKKVWDQQSKIGLTNFALGWPSREWANAAKVYGSKDPVGDIANVLTLIWDGWCEPIWETRNNILKRKPNPAAISELNKIRNRLKWFRHHKNGVLPHRFRFLTEFTDSNLAHWNRKTCRAHLKYLETGYKIHKIECKQRASGQQVITDWFTRPPPTNNPTT